MELKCDEVFVVGALSLSSNRTFMELKSQILDTVATLVCVLIVPLWN